MRTFVLLAFLFCSSITGATQQIKDVLLIGDKEYEIEEVPLNTLMSADAIASILKPETWCSASWRGYKAIWKLEDNVLYFVELIKDPCRDGEVVPIDVFFPGSGQSVKASWFSGEVKSLRGRWWGDENRDERDSTSIENYKYEQIVFDILDGVLIEKRTEIVELVL